MACGNHFLSNFNGHMTSMVAHPYLIKAINRFLLQIYFTHDFKTWYVASGKSSTTKIIQNGNP